MKKVLLVAIGLMFVGCQTTAPKKETAKDSKAATGSAAAAAPEAKDKKGKKEKKGKHFEDEDISKSKPAEKAAGGEAKAEEGKITCTSGGDTRTLEMKSGEGKVCSLIYTKGGEAKEVASGTTDASKCNEVRDRIKTNLEGAGFKCE